VSLKKLLYGFLPVLLAVTVLSASAQVTVQFVPAVYGQDVQGLAFAQLHSTSSSSMRVAVSIRVKEIGGGDVLRLKTTGFVLKPGPNQIDRRAFSNAVFSFSGNYHGGITRQSGKFPEGEYEYCFEVEVLETKDPGVLPLYEQCFMHQLQPLTPLLLINPIDGDELCNKRPDLTWQPPMPLPADARFRVVLAEIKEKQDPIEALTYNQPLINQAEVHINHLPFPVNIPELKEGSRYAWQVTVYSRNQKAILKKSEIWTFTVRCSDAAKEPVADSYRELKDAEDGDFYIAKNFLRFSLNNPYGAGTLAYSIECLSDPSLEVKNLPQLRLSPGLNKYDIDLAGNRSFKDGKEYLLKVYLPNNRQLKLRFIYKHETNESAGMDR
jgi:hypothetical protein